MRRLLLLFSLCSVLCVPAAEAQQWRGRASVGLSGGAQTNLYLDPVLGTWNSGVDPAFLAVTPRVGVSRTANRLHLDVTMQSRLYLSRSAMPQHTQGIARARYDLTSHWSVGGVGGGTRYRFPRPQRDAGRTARDSWWLLPSLRWTPTPETAVVVRAGLTQRYERSFVPTDRQTSGLVALQATYWLTDRLQGEARAYATDGRTSVTASEFGGTGSTLGATYWPTASVSLTGAVGGERLRYNDASSPTGSTHDWMGRGRVEGTWSLRPSVTLFGRAEVLYADLDRRATTTTDVHASAGLRLQVQRSLGGSAPTPSPRRRVCEATDEGLRFRVPYEGDGTLYVTGDFSNWSLPGVSMEPTEDTMWEVTLDLPPGRYTYRFRAVADGEERWIDLPSYAQTAQDPFGGTNGVCTMN